MLGYVLLMEMAKAHRSKWNTQCLAPRLSRLTHGHVLPSFTAKSKTTQREVVFSLPMARSSLKKVMKNWSQYFDLFQTPMLLAIEPLSVTSPTQGSSCSSSCLQTPHSSQTANFRCTFNSFWTLPEFGQVPQLCAPTVPYISPSWILLQCIWLFTCSYHLPLTSFDSLGDLALDV